MLIHGKTLCMVDRIVDSFRFKDGDDYEYDIWLTVFSRIIKIQNPPKAWFYHFSQKKLALLPLVKEVAPSPDRKMIKLLTFDNLFSPLWLRHKFSLKLVVEWRWLPRFPAKMALVHAQALLSIEKISYSLSYSSWNLKVSINSDPVKQGHYFLVLTVTTVWIGQDRVAV